MSNERVLDMAYSNLCHVFMSYAHDNDINEKERDRILKLFSEAYMDKKAKMFLSERLMPHFQSMYDDLCFALNYNKKDKKNRDSVEIMYLDHLKKEEEVYDGRE